MALTKQKKEEILNSTTDQMKNSEGVIFTDFTGVNVESLRTLRTSLMERGAKYQVTKRTLTRIALGRAGVDVQNNIEKTSQGLVFFPEDLPGTAKTLYEYGKKEENFKILNAYNIQEKRWLSADEVIVLAKLPSYEELIGRFMLVMQAPLKKFVMIVDQIAKQKVEGDEVVAEEEPSGGTVATETEETISAGDTAQEGADKKNSQGEGVPGEGDADVPEESVEAKDE